MARRRMGLLDEDMRTSRMIKDQLSEYERDLRRDFQSRLSQVDATVYELEKRADRFFDETIHLRRLPTLFNAQALQAQFAARVTADTAARLDAQVQELVEWMADRELRLWQPVWTTRCSGRCIFVSSALLRSAVAYAVAFSDMVALRVVSPHTLSSRQPVTLQPHPAHRRWPRDRLADQGRVRAASWWDCLRTASGGTMSNPANTASPEASAVPESGGRGR